LEFIVVEEAIILHGHLIVDPLDHARFWNAQVVTQFGIAKLGACLDKVIFFYFRRLHEVKVLEKGLHFLKEATVHKNGSDAAQKLIKVDILLLTLIEQSQDALKNLRWILQTKHLGNFDEVKAFDAGRAVILFK